MRPWPSPPEHPIALALGLLAVCLLIAANGFFVAAEFALVAVDRSRIEQRAEAGDRRARLVRALLPKLSFHLSGAQFGITVTSLVVGFLSAPVVAPLLEPLLEPVVGADAVTGVAITVAFLAATVAQMVLGELVPKSVAIARPEGTSRALAPFLRLYGIVFGPVITMLDRAANVVVRRLGVEPAEELSGVRSLAELDFLIATSEREGTLAGAAPELLARSIRFGTKTAADALVPRTALVALAMDATVDDLVGAAATTGHSRFPVYGADLDDVRGVVHVRAVHGVRREARGDTTLAGLMAEVLAVPESRELTDVLADMQSRRQHLAVVVDEYGGTAGIVTLEDIVEEIVGEIDDEYDRGPTLLTRPDRDGVWDLEGTLHPDEVEDLTGLELPEGDYDTLAGFVLERLGHLPEPGERLEEAGWRIEVTEMDRHRVARLRLRPPRHDAPSEGDG